MKIQLPQLKYRYKSPATTRSGCIELENETIHTITDLGEFYKAFGYSTDLAKQGILPDEFIWDTYFRYSDRNCASCYQLHIIAYLLKHEKQFAKKCSDKYESWLAAHAEAREACGEAGCLHKKCNPLQQCYAIQN